MNSRRALSGVLIIVITLVSTNLNAQYTILIPDEIVNGIIAEISGDIALNNEILLAPFERNRPESEYTGMYHETKFMLDILEEYGFSDIRMEKFETGGEQWDAVRARLSIVSPFKETIADHDEVAACIAKHSGNADLTSELVFIQDGDRIESYEGVDVEGKIVLSNSHISSLYRMAVTRFKAAGVVSYYTRYPDLYPEMILWSSVSRVRDGNQGFGFYIPYSKGIKLVNQIKRGQKITVHAEVETTYYPGKGEVVTGMIPGTDRAEQELLLIAHLFEGVSKQGGNDNNSGVACILETGRTIIELIKNGIIAQPRRSIRFLWVPEIWATREYIKRFPEDMKRIVAGINMDMVGEDLDKCRTIFYISRTLRSQPTFLNDIAQEFAELADNLNNNVSYGNYSSLPLKITAQNGSRQPFFVKITGYDSGSDHIVLSNSPVNIPTIYFECWPDDFYHSSMDTPDKTDATQLERVAFIAAASMISAANADPEDVGNIVTLVEGKGRVRIGVEQKRVFNLLAKADSNSILDSYKTGKIILDQAFVHEIDNLNTIRAISDNNREVLKALETAVENLNEEKAASLSTFKNRCKSLCDRMNINFEEPAPTPEELKMAELVPVRKTSDLVQQMSERLSPGLKRDHPVYRIGNASREIVNFIDGKRNILEIAHAVIGECGGPGTEHIADFIYGLEKKGSIILEKKR